jgi:N-acetylmuramoyl-L-alanine amidase
MPGVSGIPWRKVAGLAAVIVAMVAVACSSNGSPDSPDSRELSAFQAAAEAISESVAEDRSEAGAQQAPGIRDPFPPGQGDVAAAAPGEDDLASEGRPAPAEDDGALAMAEREGSEAAANDTSPEDEAESADVRSDADAADNAMAASAGSSPVAAGEEDEGRGPSYTIILDAGHGGSDTGAIANGIVERESNLDFARRVGEILVAQGHRVVQTRVDGGRSVLYPDDETIPQIAESRIDLQARVDLANQEGGDVFVSFHSNLAKDNVFERGMEVWFDPDRAHGDANFRLAVNLLSQVIAELFEFGYPVYNRLVHSDECHSVEPGLNICLPLFVLGPPATLERFRVVAAGIDPDRFAFADGEEVLRTRATEMPAALVELLVTSNPSDAAILRSNAGRQAIARGVARAILEFLAGEELANEELTGEAEETQNGPIVSDGAVPAR